MENNETAACKIKAFCCSKTFLVVAACVVCFFVGFFSGNIAGKASQKKADARIIAAAGARANVARNRRTGLVRTPNVRAQRVNPQTVRRPAVTPRRPAVNAAARPTANRTAANRTQTQTKK